ncbi:MAG TPA: translocation/assembly module TamB domain-containing protein [Bryobacteraceae bacterium]|nr:translocation/assembly module TamB domain-containing protein [Bryobacteraceae bacterium]
MTRPARLALLAGGSLAALALLLTLAAGLVVHSGWFREQVRERLVREAERATGGRVECGPVSFEWLRLRAHVQDFVLHGGEPSGAPPLFRAASVTAGFKLLSAVRSRVDLAALEVRAPQVYVIVRPDGSTNIPSPRLPASRGNALQTILDLAVGRFDLEDGAFTLAGRSPTPFAAAGRNLRARFRYERAPARYGGDLSIQPLELSWSARRLAPAGVNLSVELERNRISIPAAALVFGKSRLDLSGSMEDVAAAQGAFRFQARADLPELGRLLGAPQLEGGTARAEGDLRVAGLDRLSASGKVTASGVAFQLGGLRLEGSRADAAFAADPRQIGLQEVRFSGAAVTRVHERASRFPVRAAFRRVALASAGLEADRVTLEALGGSFTGHAALPQLRRILLEGRLANFDMRSLAGLVTTREIPWDGSLSGPLRLEGSLSGQRDAVADAQLAIAPVPSGPAVSGAVSVHYDLARDTLNLGHSSISLPHTRAEFSGTLGSLLRVSVSSADLRDLLPALDLVSDKPPASLPIELHGKAVLDGTLTGALEAPALEASLSLAAFSVSGAAFDSFRGKLSLSPSGAGLRDGLLEHGSASAQVSGSLGLVNWKPLPGSPVAGRISIGNAPAADLLALAGKSSLPLAGSLSAALQVSGSYGQPRFEGQFTAVQGSAWGESFDRVTATLLYTSDAAQVTEAQLTAGQKQIAFQAYYRHAPAQFASGRLRFQASSNLMALDQFQTLRKDHPDAAGTLQFRASGEVEAAPAPGSRITFRLTDLNGETSAAGLRLGQRQFGDVHITASSTGGAVSAHLESNFAGAVIRGSGQWRLDGDNPGSGQVSFEQVDFQRVQQAVGFLPTGMPAGGSAQGELTFSGPAFNPELWKAALTVPRFQIGPAPHLGLGVRRRDVTLTNSGPIRVSLERRVVRVESARMVGRTTDLVLAGAISFPQRSPLDLRLNGRIDLAMLQDFYPDLTASGTMLTDASIRGRFQRPQISGRLELKNVGLNLADFPNGLSHGEGLILFSGEGATIQSLTGETGGGKIAITGFAGYGGGQADFRLNARASQVRVRYPEGVSTVADASLNWTGTTSGNLLSGTVTILHSGFNPRADLGSVLSRSSQPVRTPAARSGVLGATRFDVQIETSPSLTVQSSLTQDVVMEGSLRLRGTVSNPALLGRINVVQGQLVFFGTRYTIDQGSISFYNPVRIEPLVNVDLQTRARGVDVILNIAGPLNKLALTPRSDPPMPFSQIVSLLATGSSPATTDLSYSNPLATSLQAAQPPGASSLLAEAVANPVSGRLQRFFGVTKLRIDPSLTGVEFNPQARITLEQQITPNITFTYVTNVTSTNPLVVQIEWAVNQRWSVIAVRDESGVFGMDFFYKKRFR